MPKKSDAGRKSAGTIRPSISLKAAQEMTLELHNKFRDMHDAPNLKLDNQLCKYAQEWAEHLLNMGEDFQLNHSKHDKKYGEMLYFKGGTENFPPSKVIEGWYDESKQFDWSFINHQEGTGHMTQIIWKETQKLGVGYASGPIGTVMVLLYDPQGNNVTSFRRNISPPKGWKPTKK